LAAAAFERAAFERAAGFEPAELLVRAADFERAELFERVVDFAPVFEPAAVFEPEARFDCADFGLVFRDRAPFDCPFDELPPLDRLPDLLLSAIADQRYAAPTHFSTPNRRCPRPGWRGCPARAGGVGLSQGRIGKIGSGLDT
jgi:hypothetical protein